MTPPEHILSRYRCLGNAWHPVPLVPTGFSGARLWRVETGKQTFCIRRWPSEHPTPDRLAWIHAVLRHVAAAGLEILALPLADHSGQSIVRGAGALWELTRWLPGEADYLLRPTPAKLTAAMTALARFHCAAATFRNVPRAASPGLAERHQQLADLRGRNLSILARAIQPRDWPQLAHSARHFVALAPYVIDEVAHRVASAGPLEVSIQPCIRDIWHEHVLFTEEHVTGLVDFGAMRVESVACDVARLMGSLVGENSADRAAALDAYQRLRPLSHAELELVSAFDLSTVLLGGMNWLRWVYLEDRHFPDRARVEQRFEALLNRLRAWTMSSGAPIVG